MSLKLATNTTSLRVRHWVLHFEFKAEKPVRLVFEGHYKDYPTVQMATKALITADALFIYDSATDNIHDPRTGLLLGSVKPFAAMVREATANAQWNEAVDMLLRSKINFPELVIPDEAIIKAMRRPIPEVRTFVDYTVADQLVPASGPIYQPT